MRYSRKYIHGKGIEIGALHNPMPVPCDADVKYVDRMNNDDLRKHYPELRNLRLVPVHCVCDGQTLGAIGREVYDFVVANHFLEHAENPISAIENMLRVLKVGGVLFVTIPDKKSTFDKERPSTSFEHLFEDYKQGPETSREEHYVEWVKYVVGKERPDEIRAEVKELMEQNYSIHYHVWSFGDMAKMISSMRIDLGFKFEIEVGSAAMHEAIFVLKKT